nr:unnamed protein product [Digitaria exilis]
MFRGWCSLPPPHAGPELLDDIDGHVVVGDSTISVSSRTPDVGTYAFDTGTWNWRHAAKWSLPFSGKAEYVPGLNLWFGLSASRPFHLCAYDLSAMDLINLGSGRFCVVKIFENTLPAFTKGFSDDEGGDEAVDCRDVVDWDFAVLTGIEMVRCDGEASPGKLRMLKHMSRYHVLLPVSPLHTEVHAVHNTSRWILI